MPPAPPGASQRRGLDTQRAGSLAKRVPGLANLLGARFNAAVSQQQTISHAVSYSGTGLHSGNRVTMTLQPADPGTGIRFKRLDLDGQPEIEASIQNVSDTTRSTTLSKGNIKIHTVEHVLATFAGYEIDNAIVELDANEPPIADGSSREYCRLIEEAGIEAQTDKREPYQVTEPIELKAGETVMTLFPDEAFRVTCTSSDSKGRFTQFFSVVINPETWAKELAHARTFCFYEEIEYLIRTGLIRGGSLENAVVIREDAVLTTEPLRYDDEFVRHKILDIVGDLSLVGRPLRGHLVAVKPSHTANCDLARLILAQMTKPRQVMQAFSPPPAPAKPHKDGGADAGTLALEPVHDVEQLMKILPHRYPFLMIDKVTRIDGNRLTAVKGVTINEPYFQGHFPGHPIMPGVLQLEAMAQAAGVLMLKQAENAGKMAYFMSAQEVKWRKPVRPGDLLQIDVELTKIRGKIGKAQGVCSVRGETVSEASVAFMLVDMEPA